LQDNPVLRENRTYGIEEGKLEIEHAATMPALYFTEQEIGFIYI